MTVDLSLRVCLIRRYAVEALELLDDAGYTCLVGLKGCACLQAV